MGSKISKNTNEDKTSAVVVSPCGGLGNQLFQIANGYAYSLRHNKRFFVTNSWKGITKSRPTYWNTLLQSIKPHLIKQGQCRKTKKYIESCFSYKEIPFFNINFVLHGYYQSEDYFYDFKDEIRKLFKFPDSIKKNYIDKNGICIAIHIRRGDYKKSPDFHTLVPKSYYDKAKKIIEEKLGLIPNYYYFSDEPDWVKENFKDNMKESDKVISGFKDYEELYIMTQCDHFIIANSTFSWWGAWLSETQKESEKIVIAPEPWFGIKGPDASDIYCKNWIKISDDSETVKEISMVTSRISESINGIDNPYDIYIINLKHRQDRQKEIKEDLKDTSTFNIHFFEAIKNSKGWIGCSQSHLSLIKYAKENNKPYIIVAEDDFLFKISEEKVKEALTKLTSNLSDWDVFNGSPSFWDKRNNLSDLDFVKPDSEELKNLFVKVNWGQSTSFMIYNKSSYDKMLSYKYKEEIDQYIAKNFFQIVYKNEPFSIQKALYSDVSNKTQTKDYENFFLDQHTIIQKIIPKEKEKVIGIYSIFIDIYQHFYPDFIKNCEENFLPQYKKNYYIITNNKDLKLYNDNTFIFHTEKIGWPYETLYRFKYLLQFKEEDLYKSDIIYFINSNGKFLEKIDTKIFPDESGYAFTKHHGFYNKPYEQLAYEKSNKSSTAYISKDLGRKYEYFAGGFYGANTKNHIEMCKILDENITKDENNNYIAIWHDESHINKYCQSVLKYNFKKLGIEYHVPEERMNSYACKKLIYLDKKRYLPQTSSTKDLKNGHKNINGKIVVNKYNYNQKISILMPIYNGIEYIKESVSSIINQTYTNWELLIGINGHSQNSEVYQKAKSFENDKIRVFDFFTLKGKSNTLNELVKYTDSNLISLLDVDDIWSPEKLRTQVMKTLNYDIVGSNCVYFGDKEGVIPEIPNGDLQNFDFKIKNPIINSSCIIKKELCSWKQEWDGIEDYELWLRLKSQNKKFYNIEQVLVKHRIHSDSAFNSKKYDIDALKSKF
jgi:hypothetical protein